MREVSLKPRTADVLAERGVSEFAFFPSYVLRATDPVQTAQQIWEIVPRLGGALLQAQGMVTPADRTMGGQVKVTFSLAANRYPFLLDAIRQLPDTSVIEERMAFISRELPPVPAGALRRLEHLWAATPQPMTSVITILPR
jgi:hypothetical protein